MSRKKQFKFLAEVTGLSGAQSVFNPPQKLMAEASFRYTLPLVTSRTNLIGTPYFGLAPNKPAEKESRSAANPVKTIPTALLPRNRKARRTAPHRLIDLDQPGYLRIDDVLSVVPVSRASWYAGIKARRYPPPVSLGPRSVGWRTSDIKSLIEELSQQSATNFLKSN
jgi:prophage regulatory protein